MQNEEKKFIEELSKRIQDYNNPDQAILAANLCETISKDINTDSQRFIYELLQNADDASSKSKSLDVQIDFLANDNHQDYIVVSHKGTPFSKIDIESICSAGDGTKTADSDKTGFKGIGFKSVFAHSTFVVIKSGLYCFKFDKEHWTEHWGKNWGKQADWQNERKAKNKSEQLKMPWQIIPIATKLPSWAEKNPVFKNYAVSTIIRHEKISSLRDALDKLFSESQIILFLRSEQVKITINTDTTLVLEKIKENGKTLLKRNGIILSDWLIKTSRFAIPNNIKEAIIQDDKSPQKLKEATQTEISFAIQLEQRNLKPVDQDKRLIFTYLPTSINFNLPFLVNASFLTDAGRQHLHQDIYWNKWLFQQIPIEFFTWIAELAKISPYNKQFLNVLPEKLGNSDLENSFNEGLKRALDTIAFLPNLKGDLLKVGEAILDKTNVSNLIAKENLIEFLNTELKQNYQINAFIPFIYPLFALENLGVKMFKIQDLSNFLQSDVFSNAHSLKENFALIDFIYQESQKKTKLWDTEIVANLPFIFNENKQLQTPKAVYFPSILKNNALAQELNFIHTTVFKEISQSTTIKNWLESLGVCEVSDMSLIEKTIITDKNFINNENALQVGQYLFRAHQKGQLSSQHYTDIGNLKFLTSQNVLQPANRLYLSDFYEPDFKIESCCSADIFVSNSYFPSGLKSEWKTFFLKIGVKEDIELLQIYREANYTLVNTYKCLQGYFSMYNGPIGYSNWRFDDYNLIKFTLIEQTIDNYAFAKLFWAKIFNQYNGSVIKDNAHQRGFWGHSDYSGSRNGVFLEECYCEWLAANRNCIPTKQKKCVPAPSVYSNNISEIEEIAGHYLPVFDGSPLPYSWENTLRFKRDIGLKEYLIILSAIWQEEDKSQNNLKRISIIYKHLADLKLAQRDKKLITKWGKSNKLLSKNGVDFLYPAEMSIITISGFKGKNLAYTGDEKIGLTAKTELFGLFGVKIIDKVDATISNNSIEIGSLKNKLLQIAPLLTSVSIKYAKISKKWDTEYERIRQKVQKFTFYETSEIYLSYGNEEDKQKTTFHEKTDKFYFVGQWDKLKNLVNLATPVQKLLKINNAPTDLFIVLLGASFQEGLEYLQEQNIDTSQITADLQQSMEQISNRILNVENRPYNNNDAEFGRKGELAVFKFLKTLYSEKYNSPIIETSTGFKIMDKVEVFWKNITQESNANHDFKIIESEKEIYIDSKATGANDKLPLYISQDELTLMENAEKYLIARVYNALSDNPIIKFVKLEPHNLYEK